MLRKGLILLAISLSVALAAQAQAPAGDAAGGGNTGGATPGGGTPGGGTPGGGNTGGGRPGGGNNNGGFPQQQQQQQQQRQMEMERPIFLSGTVILASGEAPLEPIMINRVCGMQKTPEGYTDSKGRFSFQVGGNQQFAVMDASIGGQGAASGFGGPGGFSSLAGNNPAMGIDLSGCQLEADAPGYRSDPIFLTRRRPMDRAEVGTIILTPLGGMQQGSVVSATSLAAPKKAKASFEKGIKELGKGPSARLDKAAEDLQTAVNEYPEYAAAWTALGQLKMQSGDIDGAITALEKALDADPRYIRPYEPLVRLYIGKGDWEHTAELTKFVLSVNPADTKMRWYQAVSTFETGRDDDAIALLSDIQKDAEGAKLFPQTHHLMGLIYAKRGQFGEAAAAYNRYLELSPDAQAAAAIKKQLNEWQQLGVL
jgi:cytochrome c-type biogenesis protein CcmH/NrfG